MGLLRAGEEEGRRRELNVHNVPNYAGTTFLRVSIVKFGTKV
jgi:hypothetical protein